MKCQCCGGQLQPTPAVEDRRTPAAVRHDERIARSLELARTWQVCCDNPVITSWTDDETGEYVEACSSCGAC